MNTLKFSRLLSRIGGGRGGSLELGLSYTGFLFLMWSFGACWRIQLKVNGIHGGNHGDWWLLCWSVYLHVLPGPYPLESHVGKAFFFLLHLGDALRAQWTLTLGLITLATRDTNNRSALRELACNPLNSHKCLNVFHSKGLSLWDLVKSGSTFTDVSVINEDCPLMKILELCSYLCFVIMANLHTFVSLEPCH